MKIRQGFVPNSSSASFILVGTQVSVDYIIDNPDEKYICMGDWIYEGKDVFDFTVEYAKIIKMFGWDEYTIVKTTEYVYDSSDGVFVENARVWAGEADMHSTSTVDEFVERYMDTETVLQQTPKRVTVETFDELDEVFIDEVLYYLDGLQEAGEVSMLGVVPDLMREFYGVNRQMANDLLRYWIKTYDERKGK